MRDSLPDEKYFIEKMTWPEVRDALKENDMVLVPVASTEQHGPHLPVNTDAVIGIEISKRAVNRFYQETGKRVLIAPPLPIGMSLHHMSYPGTISLKPETLLNVLTEVCTSLAHHGFKKIVIVNSHGGNRVILDAAARNIFDQTKAKIFVASSWIDYADPEKSIAKTILKAGSVGTSHACETETSLMMAFGAPVRVKMIPKKAVPPKFPMPDFVGWGVSKYTGVQFTGNWNVEELNELGYLGDPTVASRDTGEKILEVYVKNLTEFLSQFSKL